MATTLPSLPPITDQSVYIAQTLLSPQTFGLSQQERVDRAQLCSTGFKTYKEYLRAKKTAL